MARKMPRCKNCNEEHYGFQNCPKPVVTAPGWGKPFSTLKPGVPVVYQMPPRVRMGSLTGPDGTDYRPPEAA